MNPRWLAWTKAEGLTAEEAKRAPWEFMMWIDKHITEWAKANGYVSDLRLSHGVVVRTQAEANRAALSQLGHDAFTAYLEGIAEGGSDARSPR